MTPTNKGCCDKCAEAGFHEGTVDCADRNCACHTAPHERQSGYRVRLPLDGSAESLEWNGSHKEGWERLLDDHFAFWELEDAKVFIREKRVEWEYEATKNEFQNLAGRIQEARTTLLEEIKSVVKSMIKVSAPILGVPETVASRNYNLALTDLLTTLKAMERN